MVEKLIIGKEIDLEELESRANEAQIQKVWQDCLYKVPVSASFILIFIFLKTDGWFRFSAL